MLLASLLTACGTNSGKQRAGAGSSRADGGGATARIDKCVDRLLSRSRRSGASEQAVRRYARNTYCAPFAGKRWVYADGALSIAAQKWLDKGHRCATSSAGKTRTIPCEQTSSGTGARIIDCALLHVVRRTEVKAYITELERHGDIRCDDGTPPGELGVP